MTLDARYPQASVIVLSWNGRDDLPDCLNALLAQDYDELEILVVDNGSSDGSADLVAERFPQVRLIRNERNLGFATGNNIGLRKANGDVLVLLNQDTVVQPGWLAGLAEGLLGAPDIGIVGGKACYPDGRLQHAGGWVDERGAGHHFGHCETDQGQYDVSRDVDFVTGAGLAITRRALETIGGLDEGFSPAYYEDVDWCFRARRAGLRVRYVPGAVFVHREASILADASQEGMFLPHRNRLRFVLKHWDREHLTGPFLEAERRWLEELEEGGERLVAVMQRAYLYHLLRLGEILQRRAQLLGAAEEDADLLAGMLLALRMVVPLRPAQRPTSPASRAQAVPPDPAQVQEQLHQRWRIEPRPFRSTVPILGPLIAAFRRRWNRVSTEWYVRPLVQQQTEFNAQVVTMLDQLLRETREARELAARESTARDRLGRVLAEYIAESNREVGELARELARLQRALQTSEQDVTSTTVDSSMTGARE
jgi:GT2 family glycosyltransferase